MKNWLLAARPKTLPAAIVPVWSGCVLAWKLQGSWNPWLAFCTLAAALCIQIATNFFNDAIDARKGADTEKRLGPRRVTACGLIPRRTVLIAATFFLGLAAIFGMILFRKAGWPVIWIGLPSLYFAYGYTGGPLPLAYKGLGELFVVIFFGLVAVSGTILIQTGEWRNEAMLLGLQIGLLSAVLISINNLRDREEDSGTGKMTLAVRMGERGARVLVWLEVKAAAFAGLLWMKYQLPWLVLATIPLWTLGMYLLFRVFNDPIGHAMNRLLALAGLMLLLFAACFHAAAGIN